ncbi:hypothetical protein GALL_365520 [mine drainage metagenome]|uniref:DUF2510 domain-containing protein n=1 Tax=mine drainage metagenome TaxID=410659 RepID=A0A1J5QDJ5_9ZZZZ
MSITPDQYATTGTPPAGWYADPGSSGQRWWDGARWTDHVMPAAAAPLRTPVAVTADATWDPDPANQLGRDRYAELGLAGGVAQQRGPSGYVSPPASIDHRASTPFSGASAYGAGGAIPAAFPYSYLPGLPAPKNTQATVGFILGLVFVSVGVMFGYWFGSLLAVVVSIAGLTRARKLTAQGYPAVGRALAIWGIVLSALSWGVAIVLRLAAF